MVDKFESCREVDDFDQGFVFEDWKATHSDHEDIRDMLANLARWEAAISRLTSTDSKGLIQVLGRKLASRLSQRVKEEQGRMKEYLIELAEAKAREI